VVLAVHLYGVKPAAESKRAAGPSKTGEAKTSASAPRPGPPKAKPRDPSVAGPVPGLPGKWRYKNERGTWVVVNRFDEIPAAHRPR
jgi:hypothetical protein